MVRYCDALGCLNKFGSGIEFLCIPKIDAKYSVSQQQLQKKRRSLWINVIKEKTRISDQRICSNNFITGKPNEDESHPDWIPSVKLGTKDTHLNDEKTKRYHRRFIRRRNMKKTATKEKESATPSTVIPAEVLYDDPTLTNPDQDPTEVLKDFPKRGCDDIHYETINLLLALVHSRSQTI